LCTSFFEERMFSRWAVTDITSARGTVHCRKTSILCWDQLVICGLYTGSFLSPLWTTFDVLTHRLPYRPVSHKCQHWNCNVAASRSERESERESVWLVGRREDIFLPKAPVFADKLYRGEVCVFLFHPQLSWKDFSSSLCVQTGSGAYPASCPVGTRGPFPGAKTRPGVTLTTHPI
jgi:hypothetical protein